MSIRRSSSERNDFISRLFEMRNLHISPKAEPHMGHLKKRNATYAKAKSVDLSLS
jgi:hypothetical protein